MKREPRNGRGGLAIPADIGGYQRDAGAAFGAWEKAAQQDTLFDAFGKVERTPINWDKLFNRKLAGGTLREHADSIN